MTDKYEVVVRSAVTMHGLVLLMKTEESDSWELPGVTLSQAETVDEAVEKQVEDLTGLEVDVYQIIDTANATPYTEGETIEILVHAEAGSEEYRDNSPIKFEWTDPDQLAEKLDEDEQKRLDRDRPENFIEKLKKMPTGGL
jgi:ADP-ribose pyrophosphatase YjhB (NUDIX family)